MNRRCSRLRSAGLPVPVAVTKQHPTDRNPHEVARISPGWPQEIKGRADAEAADIYAEAYNRDAEFYRFLKTMEVLRETMDSSTVLVLSTDGDFLRYLGRAR